MSLKNNIISLSSLLSLFILFSCESPDQMSDAAYEKVKEEKLKSKDSNTNIHDLIQEPVKTLVDKKNENQNDWSKFKIEVENKMRWNENRIKEIKNRSNTDVKLFKKMTVLEKENNEILIQLIEFNEDAKTRWEKCKLKVDQNLTEMSIELKEISKNIKN